MVQLKDASLSQQSRKAVKCEMVEKICARARQRKQGVGIVMEQEVKVIATGGQ